MPILPLLLAVSGAVDPVGDLPPALEATTAPTPPSTTSGTPSGITVVLLPTVGLGVDDGLRREAAAALAQKLITRGIVIDGAALPVDQQEALAACDGDGCRDLLRPLGADAVVTSSLGPVPGELVLTVRVRRRAGTQRLQVRGSADDVVDLAARAVVAMPLEPSSSSSLPATPAPSPDRPPPPSRSSPPPTSSASPVPPVAMVLVYYAVAFIPVVGSPLFLPFLQGFAAQELGPQLVGLEFQDWGNAVAAGYLTYLAGFTLGGGAYVTGAVLAGSGSSAGYALMAGGGLLLLATLAAEPVVFHLVASSSATPADEADR